MANWVAASSEHDYEPYRRFRGGGYWLLEGSPPDTIEFERNPHYESAPGLKKLRPNEVPALGLTRSSPLYALTAGLGQLRFLTEPERFLDFLTIERCYLER